jgi:uncharacterized protein (DUF362 family)
MLIKTLRRTGGRILEDRVLQEEYRARELSRRAMMQSMLVAGGALGGLACGSTPANGGASSSSSGGATDGGVTPQGHLVGMGYDATDRAAALGAALKETVGLGMIKKGQSVYLRVNSNSGDPYPYSTAPETIAVIGGMLRDMGITDLRIGDRSFWGDSNTAANLRRNGIAQAAQALGTEAKVYDDNVDWLTLPADMLPNWTGTVRLPKDVTDADHMIILSCVKTHFIAQFTMSLKISLGLVHASDRSRAGNLRTHDERVLHKQSAQVNKAFTPSLVVQDGYSAVISGGPTVNDRPPGAPASFSKGITGEPKVFIVSTDRIAADAVGVAVLQTVSPDYERVHKTKPFENPQIIAAVEAGLGIGSAGELDLSGPTVPNLDVLRAKLA